MIYIMNKKMNEVNQNNPQSKTQPKEQAEPLTANEVESPEPNKPNNKDDGKTEANLKAVLLKQNWMDFLKVASTVESEVLHKVVADVIKQNEKVASWFRQVLLDNPNDLEVTIKRFRNRS